MAKVNKASKTPTNPAQHEGAKQVPIPGAIKKVGLNHSVDSPFPGLRWATSADDVTSMKMEMTMSEKNEGYLNLRLLSALSSGFSGRLTHLGFIPDPENGQVIMVPLPARQAGVDGVEELKYSDTENGATVNLRLALLQMKVEPKKGRVIAFPVVTRTAPNGVDYLALDTRALTTRPSRSAKKTEAKPPDNQSSGQVSQKETPSQSVQQPPTTAPSATPPAAEPKQGDVAASTQANDGSPGHPR